MSTKFPLTVLLMELAAQMRKRRTMLHLSWLQRDSNSEADALTNGEFGLFDKGLRMACDLGKLEWLVLPKLMQASEDLYKDIIARKKGLEGSAGLTRMKKTAAAKRLRWTDPW